MPAPGESQTNTAELSLFNDETRLRFDGNRHNLRMPPQSFQIVICACLRGKDVDHEVAIIGQHPLGPESFHAHGILALFAKLQTNLFGDGFDLLRIRSRANYEVVRESSYFPQVENLDVCSLFGFGRARRNEPRWRGNSVNCL
jgi:hypothetical protein